jgi:hypothetical protein
LLYLINTYYLTLVFEPQYSIVEYPVNARNQFHELKPTSTIPRAVSKIRMKLMSE